MPNRRDLLKIMAMLPITPLLASVPRSVWAEGLVTADLNAQVNSAQIANMRTNQAWHYGQDFLNGQPLRLPLGQPAQIEARNTLPELTSVHWHGMRVPNDMDGASPYDESANSHLIPSNASRTYAFTPKDPGLYWFHAHNRSWDQVGRGLYGALLVEDPKAIRIRDYVLVLDDWPTRWGGVQFSQLGKSHDWAHAGHIGQVATVNAMREQAIAFQPGEPLRLRFLNAATARVFSLQTGRNIAAQSWVAAVDGYEVVPYRVREDEFVLGPGQRIDMIVDTSNLSHGVTFNLSRGIRLRFEHANDSQGGVSVSEVLAGIRDYKPDELVPAQPNQVHDLVMQGGAMGGMRMMNAGKFWTFSTPGQSVGAPLFSGRLGETVQLNIKNETRWNHTVHWHGQHAMVTQSMRFLEQKHILRDSVTVAPGETTTVRFRLAEPGQWLLHCHMLGHQASGMSTFYEVS